MGKLLDSIHFPEDLRKLPLEELKPLAREIRAFLIHHISKTGGHLASNLGIVELTLALHYCFHMPEDKIVWDVGHQAYVHKILTGRKEQFHTLRQLDGLSGFPKPNESLYDCFATGHSSTSISAALGMAKARDLKGRHNYVVAVIGDGSMTGGLAYEALNNAGRSNTNLIVILNDNQMSIRSNVGALSRHLNDIRTEPAYLGAKKEVHEFLHKLPLIGKPIDKAIERAKDSIKYLLVPGCLFEELGFQYIGPVDGHQVTELVRVLNKIKKMNGPILLHVHTVKGKGYRYAEDLPWDYHGVGQFDIKTGKPKKSSNGLTYSQVFGHKLVELAKENPRIVAITAAMQSGTGLDEFEAAFPKRFFDVGIAEQHGVTFAAGMAEEGFVPVFAVYSTFLQRGYDQLIHDVCMQNLHVVFAIDRAGIVGADGETHQGVFDLSYLSHMPNMTILSPKNQWELEEMLTFAVNAAGPVAVRYPRGEAVQVYQEKQEPVVYGKAEVLEEGRYLAILAEGAMISFAKEARDALVKEGLTPVLVNVRFIKPLDKSLIRKLSEICDYLVTVEDNVISGGLGAQVMETVCQESLPCKVHSIGLPDQFIEQGSPKELYQRYGLDGEGIRRKIKDFITEV